jgi:hypothetical protein
MEHSTGGGGSINWHFKMLVKLFPASEYKMQLKYLGSGVFNKDKHNILISLLVSVSSPDSCMVIRTSNVPFFSQHIPLVIFSNLPKSK